jgi:hypothetical protein
MVIDKKKNYTLISSDENSFSDFYMSFLKKGNGLDKESLILKIFCEINISKKDYLLLSNIAQQKKENGTSFVMVYSNINIDDFPENFNIVPTLIEAEDILEMEAMERELGF